jgi:hypothetical protein
MENIEHHIKDEIETKQDSDNGMLCDLFRRGGFTVVTRQGNSSGPIVLRTFITIDGDVTVNIDSQFSSNELWQQHLSMIRRKTRWLRRIEKILKYYIWPVVGVSYFLCSNEYLNSHITNFLPNWWRLLIWVIIPTTLYQLIGLYISLFIKPTVGRFRKNVFARILSSFNSFPIKQFSEQSQLQRPK